MHIILNELPHTDHPPPPPTNDNRRQLTARKHYRRPIPKAICIKKTKSFKCITATGISVQYIYIY